MNLLPSQINELLVTLVLGRLCPCGHPGHGRGLGLPGMGLHRFPLPSSPSSRTPHRQCWDECPTPRRQCWDVVLLAATESRCRGRLPGSAGRLQAAWAEMVTEGPRLLSRKLFHEFLGSSVPSAVLCGAVVGVTRAVCFPACYSLTPFSSQKSFASNNKK